MNNPHPNKNLTGLYSLDVEADGPCAGLYSMLSFALVPLDDPSRAFYTQLAPISERFVEGSLKVNGWTREQTLGFPPAAEAMAAMAAWLEKEPGEGRKVIWSDNPAFDWQFFNYYCHSYLGTNAFGHSARRIADFAAGLAGNPRKTSDWKKLRTEKHTHNALDDARGNAGALGRLLNRPPQAIASGFRTPSENQAIPRAARSMRAPPSRAQGIHGGGRQAPAPNLPRATIAAYALPSPANGLNEITLKPMKQRDGSTRWAVQDQFRNCLNKSGEWEGEPSSSSRTEAFFDRCRWDTTEEAYQAWERWAATQPAP